MTMSMNRVIHAAVRRDVDRFLAALAEFPAGDHARADGLARAWANFQAQLSHHHHGEHDITWPALLEIGVSPQLLTELDSEHDQLAAGLSDAGAAMDVLQRSASASDAAAAHEAFQRLRTVIHGHLDHEESELEEVFLRFRKHPAIRDMARKHSRQSPARSGEFLAWLTDGAGPEERAGLAEAIPRPVAGALSKVFGRTYRREVAPVWG